MTAYGYQITPLSSGGVNVMLQQKETKKEKIFFLAAPNAQHLLYEHMNSLTDDLCEQWFKENLSKEERKAKQKAIKEAKKTEAQEWMTIGLPGSEK